MAFEIKNRRVYRSRHLSRPCILYRRLDPENGQLGE